MFYVLGLTTSEMGNVKHIFSPSLDPSPQGREEKNVLGSIKRSF